MVKENIVKEKEKSEIKDKGKKEKKEKSKKVTKKKEITEKKEVTKKKEEKKEAEKEEKIESKEKKENKEKKEKKEEAEKREELLVPLEDYINSAVHLGTRAVTPGMREYVYRRKADGIAVLNTKKIDERIALAADFLSKYKPEDIILCCKRDSGHKAIKAFNEATGIKTFEKYPPGMITNPNLDIFLESSVLFIIDPWLDKNALNDAVKLRIPVVALCDTNNNTNNIDVVVPCNNKSAKSIGLALYIIAKLYLKKRNINKKIKSSDFYEIEDKSQAKEHRESRNERGTRITREMIARKLGKMGNRKISRKGRISRR